MGMLTAYLKRHRGTVLLWAAVCAVFLLTFRLYHLPLGAVGYGAALSGTLGLLCFLSGFRRYRKKCRMLRLAAEHPEAEPEFPEPSGELEEKYQEIIRGLLENGKDLENQMEERYADLVDAYTVWAHQIKTPIVAMRLKLSGEDTNLSREILEEVLRIEQYVEMALVVLRLDGNSTDYVLARYELDSILRQAIHRFSSQFIRKKIRLLYQPVQYSVVTDEKWLLFVVEQILSNALKYTKPGGTITIAMDPPGILAIQDTGIGIAAEDLPRIFDKGYTGYNGRKDKKASGLGLYLCRRICENLGHSVRANSDPETGTVILLDLRRKELEAE